MPNPPAIAFRPLRLGDLPLMHHWLNSPGVMRWYEKRPQSEEEVAAKYGPRIRGEDPTRAFVMLYGGEPIGYIQTYKISDYPDYAVHLGLDDEAAGVDLFIGEDAYRHRGLGGPILRGFLREVVFSTMDVPACVIGPEPANTVAIRAYEKAGFRYWKTVSIPDEGEEYLMRIAREEVVGE